MPGRLLNGSVRNAKAALIAAALFAASAGGTAAQNPSQSPPPQAPIDAPAAGAPTAAAAGVAIDELLSGIVRLKTFIDPDARTTKTLGRDREGSGVVIGSDGLILTIGYLMVEAHAAEVTTNDGRTVSAEIVGYDHDTGFGLLRATAPLKVRPIAFGRAADIAKGERVLVAGGGGPDAVGAASVADKRPFAGYWEYLLDEAIFTTPAFPWWSGAALLNREGQLIGIGSLIVRDAAPGRAAEPGNMFVPVDRLPAILAELIADGRVSGPERPWLGLTTDATGAKLVVRRVTDGGPAEKGGMLSGDTITKVGSKRPATLAEFYRSIWELGAAGVSVPIEVDRKGERVELVLKSISRRQHLKLGSTF